MVGAGLDGNPPGAVDAALVGPAGMSLSAKWFHSKTVLAKKEYLCWSVLLVGTLNPLELLTVWRSMMLLLLNPANFVGFIFRRPEAAGMRKSSGGMAGIWPSIIFRNSPSLCCLRRSSNGGRFRLFSIVVTQPGDLVL